MALLTHIPTTLLPYAELMRLDRPTGFYYFFWPILMGMVQGALSKSSESSSLMPALGVLTIYNLLLRGYTCTWNDLIDADYDRQVERCRKRPIPRGAVTPTQAAYFVVAQLAAATAIMLFLPRQCQLIALLNVVWYGVYPYMKRITHYPQLWLGFTFAWNVFVGYAATHDSTFSLLHFNNRGRWLEDTKISSLYAANVIWPLIYDTVYAFQDLRDDLKAGVKSLAIAMNEWAKYWFFLLATIQTMFLASNGARNGFHLPYFTISVGATFGSLCLMIWKVDLDSPQSCGWWFKKGHWLAGGSMLGGLLLELVIRDADLRF